MHALGEAVRCDGSAKKVGWREKTGCRGGGGKTVECSGEEHASTLRCTPYGAMRVVNAVR